MMYAVAVFFEYKGVNTVKLVNTNTQIEAIIEAVGDDLSLCKDFDTVEEIKRYYGDGEIIVSDPIEIRET